jgi:Zn finger protein HypA/HybF involved in hydrogenase expression
MISCENCGAPVTSDFARVFGTNSNRVFACPQCVPMRLIIDQGAAALGSDEVDKPM